VATLEPNSYFIEPEDLKRLQDQNRVFFEGVGLEITTKDGVVTIVTPYEDTFAFRQGLKPNDRIIAVDNKTTQNMPIMEVSGNIRGEKGKPVTLTIERQGWIAPSDFILNRDTISHRTIKSFQLEPGFGYIRIINFLSTTDDDFTVSLNDLIKTSQLKGLIIDLRYNPGGILNQSLGLADFFLNNGIITSTDGGIKTDNKTFYARPKTLSNVTRLLSLSTGELPVEVKSSPCHSDFMNVLCLLEKRVLARGSCRPLFRYRPVVPYARQISGS
jgi:carboxyl-terminal processing protease